MRSMRAAVFVVSFCLSPVLAADKAMSEKEAAKGRAQFTAFIQTARAAGIPDLLTADQYAKLIGDIRGQWANTLTLVKSRGAKLGDASIKSVDEGISRAATRPYELEALINMTQVMSLAGMVQSKLDPSHLNIFEALKSRLDAHVLGVARAADAYIAFSASPSNGNP